MTHNSLLPILSHCLSKLANVPAIIQCKSQCKSMVNRCMLKHGRRTIAAVLEQRHLIMYIKPVAKQPMKSNLHLRNPMT